MFRMGSSGRKEKFRDTVCRLFAVACLDPLADVQRMAKEAGVPVDAVLVGPRALERRIAAIERLADTAAATTCGCSATAVTRSDRSCGSGATASTTAVSSSTWPS